MKKQPQVKPGARPQGRDSALRGPRRRAQRQATERKSANGRASATGVHPLKRGRPGSAASKPRAATCQPQLRASQPGKNQKRTRRARKKTPTAQPKPKPKQTRRSLVVSGLRPYQQAIFDDRKTGILILHWSRQIGKSSILAVWAVDRLLTRPGRLVTVLSNSLENGAEFVQKCQEVCRVFGIAMEIRYGEVTDRFENMRTEIRISRQRKTGRIKVLAANPRTARGFSGDLILDEFAFHEDSAAIWEAAEPILSSNPDFLCRIASTGNGRHNLFYRMASGTVMKSESVSDELKQTSQLINSLIQTSHLGAFQTSAAGFAVSRVTRTAAHAMGVKVYDPSTRQAITPDAARARALDKLAYDQNYECAFADESMTLLNHELISAAERAPITVDDQAWSVHSVTRMRGATGPLEVGNDIGRHRDLSVVTVIERLGHLRRVIAMLRMQGMRLPEQQKQLDIVCGMPRFRRYCGDMTGLGLGLIEYLQDKWGRWRIQGVNFSSTEPITDRIAAEGRKRETARVTEIMASNLLAVFEDRQIEIPADLQLRDDLRKPEKITSPGGRVSIAAVRDEAGHADGFWSIALAIRAGDKSGGGAIVFGPIQLESRPMDRLFGLSRYAVKRTW
jgi:phage FluMu gp28-like protein